MSGEVQGFAIAPNWMVRDTTIHMHIKLIYLILASHADRGGICFPSQTLIAEETGLTRETVNRTLAEMREMGLVQWEAVITGGGRHNRYTLNLTPQGGSDPQSQGLCAQITGVVIPDHTKKNQEQEPRTTTPVSRKRETCEPEGFAEWYALYPRHEGRAAAVKAYRAAVKVTDPHTLLAALKAQLPGLQQREKQYRKLPASWLNAGHWADESDKPKSTLCYADRAALLYDS